MNARNGSSRSGYRKSTPAERLLCANPSSSSSSSYSSNGGVLHDDDNELNEDDVFWTGDYAAESKHKDNHNFAAALTSSFSSLRRHQFLPKGFAQPETSGILAALPENEASTSIQNGSFLYETSSSRMILKPQLERSLVPNGSRSLRYQSAPVNVPAMRRTRKCDADDYDDEERDAEMLPPHEIVARSSPQSQMLAYSVLEGAGRTLKGRDLRQVRNAIWRQTGFLD